MSVSGGYTSSIDIDNKFYEKMNWFFNYALKEKEKLQKLEEIKIVTNWYKEKKEHKEENKRIVTSIVVNKIIEELLKYAQPYYVNSIIKKINVATHLKEGADESDFDIGFIPIKIYVEFDKLLNQTKHSSAKFTFQLDTSTYITKLKIRSSHNDKSIDIQKIGIKLELSLLQIEISYSPMQMPVIAINTPINLASKEFEINDLSFHIKESPANIQTSRSPLGKGFGINNNNIICQKCRTSNSAGSAFCNSCGIALRSG
jgi:hypothetical protein